MREVNSNATLLMKLSHDQCVSHRFLNSCGLTRQSHNVLGVLQWNSSFRPFAAFTDGLVVGVAYDSLLAVPTFTLPGYNMHPGKSNVPVLCVSQVLS